MNPNSESVATERHFTVAEVADLWRIHRATVERIFCNEPGVLKIERQETLYKRRYVTMRIPESVMIRVHERLHRAKER
jgi:hypothetical protein